ncbi:MAG TPA: tRNA uracil 4-sulfurtransferase ThiI [Anaerovoracaceae bacterium]|nr:tRNA uracil 4-sulfurtransferase ThiI [Anaerovoracaceae bacterium]
MNEKNIYIVRCGEVALKGTNKPYFERMLVERIKKSLKSIDDTEVKRLEGLIFVRTNKDTEEKEIIKKVSKVFGVASISPAVETESNLNDIGKAAISYMMKQIEEKDVKTFKVKAKRADKNFPIKSPEIAKIIGSHILKGCKVLKVDVHNPECELFIDVRHDKTYIYQDKIKGFGGLPLGTNGKGMVLFSGGIDSPVAAFMMAKRGMVLEAVHYHSYPYTSERAQEKVEELVKIVSTYTGYINLHIVNLLPIQEQIVEKCPEDETTILVRRFMMRIAERIAIDNKCMMLITGENLGQVASQTAEALVVTDASVNLPIMRPLIAMDKIDIMEKAKEIETYETSILPHEDCCTVFLPKHPVTKPKLEKILESESVLDIDNLISDAVNKAETVHING